MSRLRKTRRRIALAVCVAVTVVCGLALPGCVPAPETREVWLQYLQAQAAYDGCRARRLGCDDQRAAYETARDAYHAAEAVHPWILPIDGAR